MQPILLRAADETDAETGFFCRSVYAKNENFRLHYHDFFEIFLTVSPNVQHNINGVTHHLAENTLVFIRKWDVHSFSNFNSNDISFVNFAFSEQLLNELFSYLSDGFCSNELLSTKFPPSIQLSPADSQHILNRFNQLNPIFNSDLQSQKFQSRILLFELFTRYFFKYIHKSAPENDDIPLWLKKLNLKMQNQTNFSKSSEHMIELSGKSRAHLGRMLKKHYNKTIPDYLNDIRLNYWAQALVSSEVPVIDLCYECGFENISWAYTLFKRKYGVPPLQFRKENS